MRKLPIAMSLVASVVGLSVLAGCESGRTVHEDSTVKTRSDGTQVKTENKTVQNSDGTVTHTQSKQVNQ